MTARFYFKHTYHHGRDGIHGVYCNLITAKTAATTLAQNHLHYQHGRGSYIHIWEDEENTAIQLLAV